MNTIEIISILIGAAGFIVAFITLWGNSHKDTRNETKENVEIHAGLQSQIDIVNNTIGARLDSIDNSLRDLKADNRNFRSELMNLRDEMRDEMRDQHDEINHALELAEAAHRRLDRMGADPDPHISKL